MSQEKILVIGSNSFSGSHFVAHALNEGHAVWGVSRSKQPSSIFLPYTWEESNKDISSFRFFQIDLNKDIDTLMEILDKFQASIVVNFASQGMVAESWLNPTHWYRTNMVAQVELHEKLRKYKSLKKYVHVTTPEVYGSTKGQWVTEQARFSPTTPYAVSRAACDMHLMSFYKAYEFPVVFTRAANVYGPGQQLYRIIPRTILSARTGLPMQLHGGGNSIRSFIHIKDVVKGTLKLALEAEEGSSWHLSTNESTSIRELVELICEMTETNAASIIQESEERLGKDQTYLLDSSSIRKIHKWTDSIQLVDGLNDTIKWVDRNLLKLQKMTWAYEHKI